MKITIKNFETLKSEGCIQIRDAIIVNAGDDRIFMPSQFMGGTYEAKDKGEYFLLEGGQCIFKEFVIIENIYFRLNGKAYDNNGNPIYKYFVFDLGTETFYNFSTKSYGNFKEDAQTFLRKYKLIGNCILTTKN